MTGPKPPIPERDQENLENRYWELEEADVNDEEITRYKRFGIG